MSEGFSTKIEKLKNISTVVDVDFGIKLTIDEHATIEQSSEEKATMIFEEIEELINSDSIQDFEIEHLLSIAGDIHNAAFTTKTSFEAATVEYNIVKANINRNMGIFDEVYQDYYAQVIDYLGIINKSRNTPISFKPEEKYRFSSIEDLERELVIYANEAEAADEKNYIINQINDVMSSFGYNVSEEIVISTNQKGTHIICKNITDRTAVHMHMSDENRVMMEIVGISDSASKTETATISSVLHDSGKEKLVEEQVRFCTMHPKIIGKLREKGIIFDAVSRREPNAKYSKTFTPAIVDSEAPVVYQPRRHSSKKEMLREIKI
jgi:hypothetical protein